MCGINNLGNQDSVESCVKDYEELVSRVQSVLNPGKTIVLSVMPVRESTVHQKGHQVNKDVASFNHELESLCKRHQAQFVDVTASVADESGTLAPALTVDGLHLNLQGYRRVAMVLSNVLSKVN
jgi:lysophospholipase L1-like esterase